MNDQDAPQANVTEKAGTIYAQQAELIALRANLKRAARLADEFDRYEERPRTPQRTPPAQDGGRVHRRRSRLQGPARQGVGSGR